MDARIDSALQRISRDIRAAPAPRALADEARLSLSGFYELFRRETGTVPGRYLRALRLRKAQQLLTTSTLSVKEIASIVGLYDVSHFVRDFRKTFGVTPTELRRRNALALEERPINSNAGQLFVG